MTYEECAEKGMTATETAKAMGVTPKMVRGYAERNGLVFRDGRLRPGSPPRARLVKSYLEYLSPEERENYDLCTVRKKMLAVEALRAIKRHDLIVEVNQ